MSEFAVVDASPLIVLSLANRIEILRCAAKHVLVPAVVESEVLAGAGDRRTIETVRRTPWIEVVPATDVPLSVAVWDLGAGESAVLAAAARTPGTIAVIDDLAARRCAAALGVPVVGTVGLVVRARRRGLVPAVRPVLEEIRAAGLYLSDALIDQASRISGE